MRFLYWFLLFLVPVPLTSFPLGISYSLMLQVGIIAWGSVALYSYVRERLETLGYPLGLTGSLYTSLKHSLR